MSVNLPSGLSPTYWRSWHPSRSGLSVSESLDVDEEWIGGWDGVGLYEGYDPPPSPFLILSSILDDGFWSRNNKLPNHQSTSIHLTTHRLILIPDPSTPSSSTSRPTPALQTLLSNIRQAEFYTGFMRSSPKITLFLGRQPSGKANEDGEVGSSWTCGVCGFVNPVSSSDIGPGPGTTCGLCGVAFSTSRSTSSLPVTRTGTPAPTTPSLRNIPSLGSVDDPEGRIPCPVCTFLNHRSMANCEICSSPLRGVKKQPVKMGNGEEKLDIVRLSFRKGGEKEAYSKMKVVLGMKAWEGQVSGSETSF